VVDLDPARVKAIPSIPQDPHILAELGWWAKASEGLIDPRPTAMSAVQKYLTRIFKHGGLIILFAAPKKSHEYHWGKIGDFGLETNHRPPSVLSNWSLLPNLNELEITFDHGKEVVIAGGNTLIHRWLSQFKSTLSFYCALSPSYQEAEWWLPLATNKYGLVIAGAIVPQRPEFKGRILILPYAQDQPDFLNSLFQTVLPDFVPHLFPEHVEGRWVQQREYELPIVRSLLDDIDNIEEAARQQTLVLRQQIHAERERMGFLHAIVQETGDTLVAAVKQALNTIGFSSVVESDQQSSPTDRKREDLQIRDGSPLLLVEVKGIAGLPAEADVVQVWKYLAPRMRELGRMDVTGISIINHQRHLPGLDRDTSPFQADIVTNALDHQLGLMTTWDLYKLLRNFCQLNWRPDDVKPLFYKSGRIKPIPLHYELIGIIEHFWHKMGVVGIPISDSAIQVGDRLAFELPIEFVEEDVESLEVDRKPVAEVHPGSLAGVKTGLTRSQARKGTRVFRVRH
jgi:hypothetical protein